MPQPAKLIKAELREIKWDTKQQASETGKKVPVQFNPQTLKVAFSNQVAGGDQAGGSGKQYVGKGATKLSLELWFDVSVPLADGSMQKDGDVRQVTKDIAFFITPVKEGKKYVPPGLRLVWGTFLFDGIVESMNESLEYFSEDGKPLRAMVSLTISQQEIQFKFNDTGSPGTQTAQAPGKPPGTKPPGTKPMQQAHAGDSIQDMASRSGNPSDWKKIASGNLIENPRILSAGAMIDMNVDANVEVSTGFSAGVSFSSGASSGVSASVSASVRVR